MDFGRYNYDLEECPECGYTEDLIVLTVVHETATHKEGSRSFKGYGGLVGEVKVLCGDCEEVLWENNPSGYENIDRDDWEPGEDCPDCSAHVMIEHHIDEKIRTMSGDFIADNDRLQTLMYECRGCGGTLGGSEVQV